MVGDIYLGRVEAVLPGIQAAFVDIGQEKSAFLHASDLLEPDEDEEPGDDGEEEAEPEPDSGEAVVAEEGGPERRGDWRGRDRRRRGRNRGGNGGDGNGGDGNGGGQPEARQREISPRRALPNIQDILKKGQTLP